MTYETAAFFCSALPAASLASLNVEQEVDDGGGAPGRLYARGHWRPAEDAKLKELVAQHGPQNWNLIAEKLDGRSGKSCRLRWFNQLDPRINRRAFSEEEEERLMAAHRAYGNKWALIARLFPGRTDNAVKNHWHVLAARRQRHHSGAARRRKPPSSSSTSPAQPHVAPAFAAHCQCHHHRSSPPLLVQQHSVSDSESASTCTSAAAAAAPCFSQSYAAPAPAAFAHRARSAFSVASPARHQGVASNKAAIPFFDFLGVGTSAAT